MRNRRVIITGGAGLIGSHIADLAVQQGAREIVVIDNLSRGRLENLEWARQHGPVTFVQADIRDRDLLLTQFRGCDVVFHQAAIRITQCAEEPRLALEVLATGTFNVLEAAVRTGAGKIIAASSASIYGLASHFPTEESHPPYNNRTLYGAAKIFDEGMLRSFYDMYGLNYLALRYFNVYGPRMDTYGAYTEVLVRWMERLAAGQRPLIFGNGTQTMDFVFVEDIARANILAAQSAVTDEVFNVASGSETSLTELARTLAQVMGVPVEPEYGPERKVNPVPRRLASTRKAREILHFEAQTPLEDGLRKLVVWWQKSRTTQEVLHARN
ncbi:MAG: SDR family NAD(P)-dependent oxidoreductase [Chloroflexi bacterium]|nr:SDR family NAD(P)-dependent oxidoreductase [Chloroflexota bacterium]